MATDLTAWLDEREREARAATQGEWHVEPDSYLEVEDREGACIANAWLHCNDATHIAAWSPDTALRVLRALRAAKKVDAMLDHAPDCDIDVAVQPTCTCGMDELRDALDSLPGAKHG